MKTKAYKTASEAMEAWNTWRGRYITPNISKFLSINSCGFCSLLIDADGNYAQPDKNLLVESITMHENGAFIVPWPRITPRQALLADRQKHNFEIENIFKFNSRWCALFSSVTHYREEIRKILLANDKDNNLINTYIKRWNKYLSTHGFMPFEENDLRGINLSGFDLSGDLYSGVNLRYLDLSFAEMSLCKFQGVNLYGSNLFAVNGFYADLRYSICDNVDFSYSIFSQSKFEGSTLSNSDFRDAVFLGVNFDGALISNSDIRGADFRECTFLRLPKLQENQVTPARNPEFKNIKWDVKSNFDGASWDESLLKQDDKFFVFLRSQKMHTPLNDTRILNIIRSTAIAIERHPSVYRDRHEEDLRDYLLTVLFSHYPNISAETFNRSGKTDIIVKEDGRNVLVIECKFWKGKNNHFETIGQIQNYLTWRDKESAIVYFVAGKNMKRVLKSILDETNSHSCFKEFVGEIMEGWFVYKFALAPNSEDEINLNILALHFPNY